MTEYPQDILIDILDENLVLEGRCTLAELFEANPELDADDILKQFPALVVAGHDAVWLGGGASPEFGIRFSKVGPGGCDECKDKGWDHFNDEDGGSVQRCDACEAFPDDAAALRRVVALAEFAHAMGEGRNLNKPEPSDVQRSNPEPEEAPMTEAPKRWPEENLRDRIRNILAASPNAVPVNSLTSAILDEIGDADWLEAIFDVGEPCQFALATQVIEALPFPMQYSLAVETLRRVYQTQADCGPDRPVEAAFIEAEGLMHSLGRSEHFDADSGATPLARLFEAFGSWLSCELEDVRVNKRDPETVDGLAGNLHRLVNELDNEARRRRTAFNNLCDAVVVAAQDASDPVDLAARLRSLADVLDGRE